MKVAEDQLAGIVDHKPPSTCDGCGKKLPTPTGCDIPGRQVLDLPPMAFEAIEHRVLSSACSCGKVHYGEFPPEVAAPVQYGSRIKAAAVFLNAEQMVPLARTANTLQNISGLSLSASSVHAFVSLAGALVAPVIDAIAELCKKSSRAGADETGGRVSGKLHWIHVCATQTSPTSPPTPSAGGKPSTTSAYSPSSKACSRTTAGEPTSRWTASIRCATPTTPESSRSCTRI